MKRPPSKPRAVYSTSYPPQSRPTNQAAIYGHYEPSRARVQFLVDHALTWGLDGFWEQLALRYMTIPPPYSPWNEVLLVANTASRHPGKKTIFFIYELLYRGKVGGSGLRIAAWDISDVDDE